MANKYTGFESYLKNHEFTPEFIHDYEYWAKRIFYNWKFKIEFDTFYSICWEAILNKIDEFDPNIATIQTFCISRINNEAWRLYMKNKNAKPEIDCNSPVVENTVEAIDTEELEQSLDDFERYCNKLGVSFNKKQFYADYIEGKDTAPMIAYTWWKASNNEVGGINDFQKRKRRTNGQSGCKE